MTARKTSRAPAKTADTPAASAAASAPKAAPAGETASDSAGASVTPLPSAEPDAAATDQRVLRKKDLFDRVAEATGARKKDVKPIVEAALQVLGDALSAGDDLVLPPLGRARVNRQKDLGSAEMLVIQLRRQDGRTDAAGTDDGAGDA